MIRQSLKHKKILVTRSRAQAADLCRAIEERGGHALLLPALEIIPAASKTFLAEQLQQMLPEVAAVILTSANVVSVIGDIFASFYFTQLKPPLIFAIGPKTQAQLQQKINQAIAINSLGIEPAKIAIPTQVYNSEGLLDLPQWAQCANLKVLLLTGQNGRDTLEKTLTERGAIVSKLVCYQRQQPDYQPEWVRGLLDQKLDAITILSQETLDNLIAIANKAGQAIWHFKLIVLSERIAQYARQQGFTNIYIAKTADQQALLNAIEQGTHDDG